MKLIVDAMTAGEQGARDIWLWLCLFVSLVATESVLWRLGGWLGCHAVVDTGVDMRLDLSGQSMRFFSEHLSGSLGSRVTTTAGASGSVYSTLSWHIVPPLVDFLGAVALFTTIDPRMALALIAFVAIVATLVVLVGVRGQGYHQAYAEEGARVGGELVDVVGNIWAVKAFSARHREHQRLQEAFGIEAAAQRRSWLYLEKVRVLHDVCLWLMSGTMLAWSVRSWQAGLSTPGDVVLVSALTFRLLHGSRDLALAFVHTSHQLAVIREMLGILARPHQVPDTPLARPVVPRSGALRLERVSFSYGDGRPILRDFDLEIRPGERVGIVGASGAGKSTLVGLVQRLDDVQEGCIYIDGQPITELQQDALRAAIAVVPQEVSLFHRSVLENIRYGNPSATDEQVWAAARAAHCESFLQALPDGLHTVVGERGTRLSGGQRQRIGIARAFLKDAPILILDEATSALDSQSEVEIQLALSRLMRGRTVLAVAHRLATVSAFDRVVVIQDGRIVEDGPPDELRRRGGVFTSLWRLQAEGFDLDAA
jgi:ATP-binding cassette subfamily B protein